MDKEFLQSGENNEELGERFREFLRNPEVPTNVGKYEQERILPDQLAVIRKNKSNLGFPHDTVVRRYYIPDARDRWGFALEGYLSIANDEIGGSSFGREMTVLRTNEHRTEHERLIIDQRGVSFVMSTYGFNNPYVSFQFRDGKRTSVGGDPNFKEGILIPDEIDVEEVTHTLLNEELRENPFNADSSADLAWRTTSLARLLGVRR